MKVRCWATAGYKDHGKEGAIFGSRCRKNDGHDLLRNDTGHNFPKEGDSGRA